MRLKQCFVVSWVLGSLQKRMVKVVNIWWIYQLTVILTIDLQFLAMTSQNSNYPSWNQQQTPVKIRGLSNSERIVSKPPLLSFIRYVSGRAVCLGIVTHAKLRIAPIIEEMGDWQAASGFCRFLKADKSAKDELPNPRLEMCIGDISVRVRYINIRCNRIEVFFSIKIHQIPPPNCYDDCSLPGLSPTRIPQPSSASLGCGCWKKPNEACLHAPNHGANTCSMWKSTTMQSCFRCDLKVICFSPSKSGFFLVRRYGASLQVRVTWTPRMPVTTSCYHF